MKSRVRWIVCGLLFLVTANNYFDRQIFGVLAPELIRHFHWQPADYTDLVTWFDVAYGIGFLVAGRFLDLVGTRIGFAAAVAVWSLVSIAHAGLSTLLGFKVVRALLGLSEAGHLPAAIKVVAEWFPQQERAFATGLYKAGGDIGAILVPVVLPWLYFTVGWRWAFVVTGGSGLIWLAAWLWYFRSPAAHPGVAAEELALIRSTPTGTTASIPWPKLLARSETYGYIAAKFLTDAVWHWYLYLLPYFLSTHFKLSIKQFGPPLIAVYAMADFGSIGGGWLSSHLMKIGWTVTRARKWAMFICCCAVLPAVFVPHTSQVWIAVGLVGLAMAAHQGWTSNLFTTVSDLYPQGAVGSIVGIGGACGMVGAAALAQLTGYLLTTTGSYTIVFLIAGTAYLAAWGIFHLLAPSLEPLPLTP